jgi:Planctomycete cytochrome C
MKQLTVALFGVLCACITSCFLDPEVKSVRTPPLGGEATAPLIDAGGDASAILSFARDIRPLLAGTSASTGCRPCHFASDSNPVGITIGGLDLTTLGMLKLGGNSSGARIVVAGKPDESVLVQRIEGTLGTRMPKNREPLLPADIAKIRLWIAQGARGGDTE